jgi:tRNA A37 threonylcarbamoyladenosine synthetase subunit TsaC/SUA5/YrdC
MVGEIQDASSNEWVIPGTLQDAAVQDEAARIFAQSNSIILDNGPVFGIWINADNQDELDRVADLKQRRNEQRYATSVSAEAFIERIDPDRIHRELWYLLEDPEVFTSRLGAVAFVRAPGRKNLVEDGELPELAVTPTEEGPIIQNWVPEGKDDVNRVLAIAAIRGGITNPVVTSLNLTGQPEITDPDKAMEFASTHKLMLALGGTAVRSDCEGSFTIIGFTDEPKIPVYREGNVGMEIMSRILLEHSLELVEGARVSSRPLTVADNPDLERATKVAARQYTLEHLGWTLRSVGTIAASSSEEGGWPQVSQYCTDGAMRLHDEFAEYNRSSN